MKFERCKKGIKRGNPFSITVDGEKVEAYPGETVAAAMLSAGKNRFGDSCRKCRPHGVYCGIGVCYSCTVTIDDIPSQQACQTEVRDQMVIKTERVKRESRENS